MVFLVLRLPHVYMCSSKIRSSMRPDIFLFSPNQNVSSLQNRVSKTSLAIKILTDDYDVIPNII
jgi:hypothetical protein